VKDLAQDVADGVLGAAKDGSVKVFIVVPPPTLPHMKDEHVKDAVQDVVQDVAQDVAQDEAQDGGVKVLIFAHQHLPAAEPALNTHAWRPPTLLVGDM